MKRILATLLCLIICTAALCGCSELLKGVETDYPAAIMVEGEVYLKSGSPMPAEVDPSAIIGYTDSYTDTFPKKDGETNFNRELDMPYARVEGGIAVLYENEWYLCTPMNEDAKPVENNKVYGTAVFYDGPVKEAQASKKSITVGHSVELTQEQADKLKAVVDNVDEWTDDHMVDRLAYWFNGHFELADREFEYYFTYQYNVIYYDHYFAEIPEDDMRFIMELNPGGSEKPSEGSGEDVPFYVISDGKRVAPHVEFAYSREWTGDGWLYADGVDWSIDFSQIYMELPVPVVSLTDDFAVEYGKGVNFYNISVYDAEFEQLCNNMDFSCLNELSDGDYYIGISVNIDGKYIESEGESEYTGLVGIYKLEKYGADHVELSGSASKNSTAASDLTPSADSSEHPDSETGGAPPAEEFETAEEAVEHIKAVKAAGVEETVAPNHVGLYDKEYIYTLKESPLPEHEQICIMLTLQGTSILYGTNDQWNTTTFFWNQGAESDEKIETLTERYGLERYQDTKFFFGSSMSDIIILWWEHGNQFEFTYPAEIGVAPEDVIEHLVVKKFDV